MTRDLNSVEQAVDSERGLWSDAIYRAAEEAGIDRRGLSPGQVLTKMAGVLARLLAQNGTDG